MKNIMIIIFMLLLVFNLNAQEDIIPKITPPYPATGELGKFGNMPIGMFTGSPSINLDIYELKESGKSIPITISYSSSGVMIDAIPKQLGIDWNLIATGVITRTVKDLPDEDVTFYNVNANSNLCLVNSQEAINMSSSNVNTEKDIFSISAFGITGKFLLNDDGVNTTQIEKSKIKIQYLGGNFIVTDIDGTIYIFGGENAIENSTVRLVCGSLTPPIGYITAWYLKEIDYTNGQKVNFTYVSQNYQYISSYSQTAKTVLSQQGSDNNQGVFSPLNIQTCYTIEKHNTVMLSEILSGTNKIAFDYEYKNIPSNYGSYNSKQLTKISVFENLVIPIKHFTFEYFLVDPSQNFRNSHCDISQKRIFLKNVKEYDEAFSSNFIKYSFDYYDKEQLPPRHSFAKDIYGYFNGKSNANIVFNNLNTINPNIYKAFSGMPKANREADSNYVYKGMLKEIIYPTKGKTEFLYEPNKGEISRWIITPFTTINTGDVAIESLTPFIIPFSQEVFLGIFGSVKDDTEFCIDYYQIPHHLSHISTTVEILNANTNQVVYSVVSGTTVENHVIILQSGSYILKVKGRPCSYGKAILEYKLENDHYETSIGPLAGVRVWKTIDNDLLGNNTVKRYYYTNDLNVLNGNSANFPTRNPFEINQNLDFYSVEEINGAQTPILKTYYSIPSSSKYDLFSFEGYSIAYNNVIESIGGDNFENGGVSTSFNFNQDDDFEIYCGNPIRGVTFCNSFLNGKISNKILFKKENGIIKKIQEEAYNYNNNLESSYANYTSQILDSKPITITDTQPITLYSINRYFIKSYRNYLSSIKSNTYDINGQNPIERITTYNYDNSTHLQLTSQTTTNSKNETLETKYYYPQDTSMLGEPYLNELIAKNIVGVPLKTETFKGTEKLSEQTTKYGSFPSSVAGQNLLLPQFIYSSKGATTPENKITFNYDTVGNVTQYTQENGVPTSILWGYNKTQPVAKLENIAYVSIPSSLITTIQAATDSPTATEAQIITALNALRSSTDANMVKAMITTFTYKPLIGVSTITDPKGDTITYHYDSFGRLQFVKDKNGKILSENEYNYKP